MIIVKKYEVLHYDDVEIQWFRSIGRNAWYRGQDIGRALGFTANGRNMTRNFAAKWKTIFEVGVHYQIRERGSIWLNSAGLFLLFSTLMKEDFIKNHARVRRLMASLVFVEFLVAMEPPK